MSVSAWIITASIAGGILSVMVPRCLPQLAFAAIRWRNGELCHRGAAGRGILDILPGDR
jgi:hypothetical protein